MTSQLLFIGLLSLSPPLEAQQSALFCHQVFTQPGSTNSVTDNRLPLNFDWSLFPRDHMARTLIEMAQQNLLLAQDAPTLEQMGLLPEDHGLCASACVTNLLGAMSTRPESLMGFRQKSPEILSQVVRVYSRSYAQDARLGARLDWLTEIVQGLFPDWVSELGPGNPLQQTHLQVQTLYSPLDPNKISQRFSNMDSLALGTVMPVKGDTSISHALIFLHWDLNRQHIYLSDPNEPNHILRVPYRKNEQGDVILRAPHTFGPEDLKLLELRFFTRKLYSQQ